MTESDFMNVIFLFLVSFSVGVLISLAVDRRRQRRRI
jgi:hypothetical protein